MSVFYSQLLGALLVGALMGIGIMVALAKVFLPEPNGQSDRLSWRMGRLEWGVTAIVIILVLAIVIGMMDRHITLQRGL